MFTDFVMNGRANGETAVTLAEMRYDTGLMRPYFDSKTGIPCATINTGRTKYNDKSGKYEPVYEQHTIKNLKDMGIDSPAFNATSLRKEEWIQIDRTVIMAARARLRAWSDLAALPGTMSGFDGMGKTILEHETMSDPGEAVVDMDGLSDGRNDQPVFQLQGLPLPITHSDFWFSKRKLAVSRNGATPLDMTMAEAAGRRVGEMIEKTLIGIETGITYGGNSTQVGGYGRTSSVYGYLNFSARLTKTNLTIPTGSNPEATVADILAMREQLYANNFYGPFMVYLSTDWDLYMDNDYARLGGNNASQTLRDRLRAIEGIVDVKRLDYLTATAANSHAFTAIMVQMTPDVARAVIGMPITTVQWQSQGGMRENYRVMTISVPQLRADYNGSVGLLHARTA